MEVSQFLVVLFSFIWGTSNVQVAPSGPGLPTTIQVTQQEDTLFTSNLTNRLWTVQTLEIDTAAPGPCPKHPAAYQSNSSESFRFSTNGHFAHFRAGQLLQTGQWVPNGSKQAIVLNPGTNHSTELQVLQWSEEYIQLSRKVVLNTLETDGHCTKAISLQQWSSKKAVNWLWPAIITGVLLMGLMLFIWRDLRSNKRKDRILY